MNIRGIVVAVTCGWTLSVVGAPAPAQGTWRASVNSLGGQGGSASHDPSISESGRFVAFGSSARNLVPGDNNLVHDVFVRDRKSGTTMRVSLDSSGGEADLGSYSPSISRDGRFVAFQSAATNLVPDDTGIFWDVFVHDRQSRTTTRVSVDSSGGEANDGSGPPSISGDGRFVAFPSGADNLVSGDTNDSFDVFLHDRLSGATTRVSVASSGVQGDQSSYSPSTSREGRFVAFKSMATNLVPGDTNRFNDVFVYDRLSGATTRVSVSSSGVQGDQNSYFPSISRDGRFVAFASHATNLVPGDTNGDGDVFVHDRQSGATTRVSVSTTGRQGNAASNRSSISGDGRFVAFTSYATNLVQGDTNVGTDVFLHDRQTGRTTRVSVDSSGVEGNGSNGGGWGAPISGDGRFVPFYSNSTNLVPGDTNNSYDVFVHGPYLSLEASPATVSAGATLILTTWTGQPSGLALLAAVEVNGTPLFTTISLESFDPMGLWTVSGTVPPRLTGNVMTFQSLGIAPTGKVSVTNLEAVTFR